MKNNLLVSRVLVVFLEEIGVVHEIFFDLEVVDGKEGHGLIEILCFLPKSVRYNCELTVWKLKVIAFV